MGVFSPTKFTVICYSSETNRYKITCDPSCRVLCGHVSLGPLWIHIRLVYNYGTRSFRNSPLLARGVLNEPKKKLRVENCYCYYGTSSVQTSSTEGPSQRQVNVTPAKSVTKSLGWFMLMPWDQWSGWTCETVCVDLTFHVSLRSVILKLFTFVLRQNHLCRSRKHVQPS